MNNNKNLKTFEQRMREHRMQYEVEHTKPSNRSESNPHTNERVYSDSMYLTEKEDDQYITVLNQKSNRAAEVSPKMQEEAVAFSAHDQRYKEPMKKTPMTEVPMHSVHKPETHEHREMHMHKEPSYEKQPEPYKPPMHDMEKYHFPEKHENPLHIAGYLHKHINRMMRVEFLIGASMLHDKVGKLVDVGPSYIVLEAFDDKSHIVCDMHSIKFITIMKTTDAGEMINML